jgi:glycosyltransferase involved in cell wall biosynthesis
VRQHRDIESLEVAGPRPEQPTGTADITVVVPACDGGDALRRCLHSIAANSPAPRETIVVADGAYEAVRPVAEAEGARVVTTSAREGPARARNVGARAASGDVLLFVDSDVVLPADAVSQVAAAFREDADLDAVFGSYDDAPAEPNFLSQYENLLHHYTHQAGRERAPTFWAGCGAVRRDVFLAVGGFDERYRQPCIEDVELGYRLNRRGHRVALRKTLQVTHLKRWGAISLVGTEFCRRAVPWGRLTMQYRSLINDLDLRPAGRVSAALVYGAIGAVVAAFWWPWALIGAGAASVALLTINAPLYRFFWRKRGPWFALRSVPWHWLFYLYGALGFAVGVGSCLFLRPARPGPPRDPVQAPGLGRPSGPA